MFVYGIYRSEEAAARAVEELANASFAAKDISALMRGGPKVDELLVQQKTGAVRGAALGAALGAIGGALLFPGAGLFAGGPLLVALKGAIASGAVGAGFGGLGGLAFFSDEIEGLEHEFSQGGAIVGVETHPGRVAAAEEVLRAAGAAAVSARDEFLAS